MRVKPILQLVPPAPRELPVVRSLALVFLVTLVALISPPLRAAEQVVLDVKVIHAHNKTTSVDPRIAPLIKELASALKYTGYDLKDQASFTLEPRSVGRMKLPSGAWLTLTPLELKEDKLRLELEVKDLKFKTTVSIGRGATLAVGGPPFEGGVLILAVTRRSP